MLNQFGNVHHPVGTVGDVFAIALGHKDRRWVAHHRGGDASLVASKASSGNGYAHFPALLLPFKGHGMPIGVVLPERVCVNGSTFFNCDFFTMWCLVFNGGLLVMLFHLFRGGGCYAHRGFRLWRQGIRLWCRGFRLWLGGSLGRCSFLHRRHFKLRLRRCLWGSLRGLGHYAALRVLDYGDALLGAFPGEQEDAQHGGRKCRRKAGVREPGCGAALAKVSLETLPAAF